MDVQVCLFCGLSIDDSEPYCSTECRLSDDTQYSSRLFPLDQSSLRWSSDDEEDDELPSQHQLTGTSQAQWIGKGCDGIAEWAAAVKPGVPTASPSRLPSPPPQRSTIRPRFSRPRLLQRQTVSPTLCMSTPQTCIGSTSVPILTPQQQIASLSHAHPNSSFSSVASPVQPSSRLFTPTPSSSSTPTSVRTGDLEFAKTPIFGSFASGMHSWMSSASLLHRKPSPDSQLCSPNAKTFTVLAKAYGPQHHFLDDYTDDQDFPELWDHSATSLSPVEIDKPSSISPRSRPGHDSRPVAVPNHPAFRSRGRSLAMALL